jgi:hypothetical protein
MPKAGKKTLHQRYRILLPKQRTRSGPYSFWYSANFSLLRLVSKFEKILMSRKEKTKRPQIEDKI